MKNYTSLDQSKKLAKILPLDSADMCYKCLDDDPYDIVVRPYHEWKEEYRGLLISKEARVFPAWSLTSLYELIGRACIRFETGLRVDKKWNLFIYGNDYGISHHIFSCDNLIDGCVEIIELFKDHKEVFQKK